MTLRWDDWSRPEIPVDRYDDATGPDRYDVDPPLHRRPPTRQLGDPADDATMPIPFNGRAVSVNHPLTNRQQALGGAA